MAQRTPVPFTVIGGFLGAGKTTLINRLLGEISDLRLVVLVNDFGAINIDAALIAAQSGDTIALTNGCVCCAIGNDFGRGILQALARDPAPEHILVEASGVADPGVLAEIAMLDPDLALSGVIVLADAATLPALIDDRRVGDTLRRQLAAADLVVLSKTDLVDGARRSKAAGVARAAAPSAVVFEGITGEPVSEILLGPHPRAARTPAPAKPPDHSAMFSTVTLFQSGTIATADLEAALGGLLDGVWRIKGFVRVAEAAVPVLVQRVGRRLDISPSLAAAGVDTALVLIGDSDVFRAASMLEPLGFAPARAAGLRLTPDAIGKV